MNQPNSTERAEDDFTKSLNRLKEKSKEVKARIEQEKRRHDLLVDSKLGDPEREKATSDGRLDLPDEDEN
ncbi:MAG: hypothetical protein JO312_10115 [Hyphomicrobiales bacterium]|nr:hypothetical protein [Hyphomicrobiales bacterium]